MAVSGVLWESGMTVTAYGHKLGHDSMQDLRELRLWHWNRLLAERRMQEMVSHPLLVAGYKRLADFHLKQVQTLNMFFPVGDTAEQDHAKHPNMFKYMP